MELHRTRDPGQETVAVFDEFVGIARSLETYGIDPHPVKDHRGTQLYLGINFSGISTFAAGRRAQHFRWPEVHKINFEGKMFIIHLAYTDDRREVVSAMGCDDILDVFMILLLFYRKSIRLASNVRLDLLVDTSGDVP